MYKRGQMSTPMFHFTADWVVWQAAFKGFTSLLRTGFCQADLYEVMVVVVFGSRFDGQNERTFMIIRSGYS